jgi:hypothetical protein
MFSWPIQSQETIQTLYKEILSFLWAKMVNAETLQKRRLVARKQASFGMGHLQIQHPEETAKGLRINLIQKYHQNMEQGNPKKFTQAIEEHSTKLEESVSQFMSATWTRENGL